MIVLDDASANSVGDRVREDRRTRGGPMTLRLGALETWWDGEAVVPGRTLEERLANLRAAGYDGVQLGPASSPISTPELRAMLAHNGVTLMTHGIEAPILASDSAARDAAVSEVIHGLEEASDLEATGSMLVPVRQTPLMAPPPPRQFGTGRDESLIELERRILVDQLGRIAVHAERLGIPVWIEPLNRFETHLIKTIDAAVAICRAVGSPAVGIAADLFHMNIEERDIAASLLSAAGLIGFVQLSDSNRYQPGAGHLDFRAAFAALRQLRYDGWLALECKLDQPDHAACLTETARFIEREWAEAEHARGAPASEASTSRGQEGARPS